MGAWSAVLLRGVDGPPGEWTQHPVRLPAATRGFVGAAVVVEDGWLYVFATESRSGYLTRTPLDDAGAGDLTAMTWWDGSDWSSDPNRAAVVVPDAHNEFTVHRRGDRYVLVDVAPYWGHPTYLHLRWADTLTGPWSKRQPVYVIPGTETDTGIAAYAGRGHPELAGHGLLVTYVTNTDGDGERIWADETVYYPEFVRLDI